VDQGDGIFEDHEGDVVDLVGVSRHEAVAQLTASGAAFEMTTEVVAGQPMRVYRQTPRSMREVFHASLEFGDRMFLVFGETRWTFTDFGVRVRRLAAHLTEDLGVAQGDRVAIGMRNYPEWVVCFWATQYIGAVAVPLNAWWTGHELSYAIRDSGSQVLIVDEERWERIRTLEATDQAKILLCRGSAHNDLRITALETVLEGPDRDLSHLADIDPDDPSTVMYTSGTTGDPKGAIQTHRNHCTNIMNTALSGAASALMRPDLAAANTGRVTVALQTFPFFHIGGMTGLYVSTSFGLTLVLMHKWDAAEAVDLLEEFHINSLAGVPTVVQQFFDELDRRGVTAESLTSVSSGGAPVPPNLIERMGDRSRNLIRPGNGYGLTETTSAVVVNSGDEYYGHPDSVGRPVPVADIEIRDETGVVLPEGQVGELWVRGPNVVAGYWNKPEATAQAFVDGWFRSGDAAFVRDGLVYVVDRLKDVVLRGGENVYCAEVEAAILANEEIHDVAVIGIPHDVLGEEVAAVIRYAPGKELAAAELQRRLRDRLAQFKIPSHIIVSTDELPRTATGKLLKRDLRQAARSALAAGRPLESSDFELAPTSD
jgi:long-chain acyl-CoA synthetase